LLELCANVRLREQQQAVIWLQLVPDSRLPSILGTGGEASCEVAHDGESQALLSEGQERDGDSGCDYDVARELDALEAAVVNGRRAQVREFGQCGKSAAATIQHIPSLTLATALRSGKVVAPPLILGRLEPQHVSRERARQSQLQMRTDLRPKVLAMLLLVFTSTAVLSSAFLSLTIAFACFASIPPRTMAFTLLAVGAEAPDLIVNFIASK
jgi:Ca2+/Na+ antiporter